MQSGMFVTFVFYPVRDVARMAHRCVVMYSRDEIVTARRAAGLAVNLDGRSEPTAPPANTSMRVGGAANTNGGDSSTTATTTASSTPTPEPSAARLILASGDSTNTGSERRRNRSRTPNFTREAQRAIRSALAAPQRFTQWSEASHGLTVSALAPVEIENRYRMTVIAVRNTTTSGLRLVAGQPDLDVETVDSGSRPVQIQQVTKLHRLRMKERQRTQRQPANAPQSRFRRSAQCFPSARSARFIPYARKRSCECNSRGR